MSVVSPSNKKADSTLSIQLAVSFGFARMGNPQYSITLLRKRTGPSQRRQGLAASLDASTGTFSAAHFRCLNSTSTSALTQLQALTQITLHQRLHISPKSRAVDTPRKALSHRHHGLQSTNARSRAANASRAR
jgi:hypothetical protein